MLLYVPKLISQTAKPPTVIFSAPLKADFQDSSFEVIVTGLFVSLVIDTKLSTL